MQIMNRKCKCVQISRDDVRGVMNASEALSLDHFGMALGPNQMNPRFCYYQLKTIELHQSLSLPAS